MFLYYYVHISLFFFVENLCQEKPDILSIKQILNARFLKTSMYNVQFHKLPTYKVLIYDKILHISLISKIIRSYVLFMSTFFHQLIFNMYIDIFPVVGLDWGHQRPEGGVSRIYCMIRKYIRLFTFFV